VSAYDASAWSDLFVATAGASAALAGLLFVAVSINLERILKSEGLPERALETLLLLMGVLIISMVALNPAQGETALGVELIILGLISGGSLVALPFGFHELKDEPRSSMWIRWAVRTAVVIPLVVSGVSLLAEAGGGLNWVIGSMVFAVAGAVANAWVLLVEVMR
jgi:hypothetical protein